MEGLLKPSYNYMVGEYLCHTCNKLNDQEDIFPCDGQECRSGLTTMHHQACMVHQAHNEYPEGAFLCHPCIAAGVEPFIDRHESSEDEGFVTEGSEEEESDI